MNAWMKRGLLLAGLSATTVLLGAGLASAAEDSATADLSVQVTGPTHHDQDVTVLDVREPHEWQICHIEGAELVPLSELPARVHELDSSRTYYVHCKSGVRSARAIEFLQEAGFTRLRNVRGGIKAWAEEVDRSMPTY